MKPFFYAFAVLALVAVVPVTVAAQARYQIISLSEGVDFGSEKVMILDTTAGHLWTWTESPSSRGNAGGRVIIYQGQVRPGKRIGDVIERQEWSGN
ncbi:MAG: hypothetical protein ACREVK_10450 [Gammaproteobacteria bacterium]